MIDGLSHEAAAGHELDQVDSTARVVCRLCLGEYWVDGDAGLLYGWRDDPVWQECPGAPRDHGDAFEDGYNPDCDCMLCG